MTDFEVVRSTTIQAPPETVHALLDDFHEWQAWSPWEDVDPDMERTYGGADSGEGATYAWSGNRKAGSGTMTITSSSPVRVDVLLEFTKPMRATNHVAFELVPAGGGTQVTWRMSGTSTGVFGLVSKVFPVMDKMVGKDFEKGLAKLKAAAEA